MTKTVTPLPFTSLVKFQGYFNSFKVEFDFGDEPVTLVQVVEAIKTLELAGFKGTTYEKKLTVDDVIGKHGKVSKVEATKTKNGKDAWIAHVAIEGRDEPLPIMFFNKGGARVNDLVKIIKNDTGYISFELIDENGNVIPF